MILLEESLEVSGDAEVVLGYVADFAHLPAWDPSVVRVQRLDDAKEVAVGSRFLVSLKSLGRTVNVDYRVVELTDRVATLVGSSSGVNAVDEIRVEQRGSRVRVSYRAEISLLGILRPMEGLLRSRIVAGGKAAITNLRERLEHLDVARRAEDSVPAVA
ncbi:MAG: SRPBCC family protein [Polyangiaceae bacterium]|nr:SRPBCC family protein [Polyangiaceae bacterium]MCB9605331.1 SRPBCC family protein [Polyangiaceae bacterium]